MVYHIYRRLRFGLFMVLAVALVAACQRISSTNSPVKTGSPANDCQVVHHAVGEACIPLHPQRVVALDSSSLEYLLSLGIQPIGAPVSDTFAPELHQDLTGITEIGSAGEPSLEKVLSLQPDLIVGTDYYETIYQPTSKIAPTVLWGGLEHSGTWKEAFNQFAQLLQKTDFAAQVMQDYATRLNEFKQQMGETLHQTKVSVVRLYPDRINLYLQDSFCGTVLQDAGLSRPSSQAIAADDALRRFGNAIQVSISKEVLAQADGDVLFVWTGENTPEANQSAQQKLVELSADPLWQRLAAVEQDRFYPVPSYWIGIGPIAANAILDDLFKYLVEES